MNAKRQKGAALIIALVIVAMATILSSTLLWENHLNRRRTATQLHGAEALANALSVEDFVRVLLAEDERESDHLQEPWAQQGNIFPIEGGSLTGAVTDLQGRFNINNLYDWQENRVNEEQVAAYRALIQTLGLDERLVDATVDWIDPDAQPRGFAGAEDDTYLRNTPAYRAANQPLADIDELRLLANMTPEQFNVLAPYVTALPPTGEPTKVNINTASPELLAALGEGLSPDAAAQLVELRNQEGFRSLQAAQDVVGATGLPDELFGVQSNHFRLHVLAVVGSSRVNLYSVLQRDAEGNVVRVTSRSLGTP